MEAEFTGAAEEKRNGVAVASMVLGLAALLLFCVWWIALPAAIAAIIFGLVVRRRPAESVTTNDLSMATVGLVSGAVALTLLVLVLIVSAIGYNAQPAGAPAPPAEPTPMDPTNPADPASPMEPAPTEPAPLDPNAPVELPDDRIRRPPASEPPPLRV